MRLPLLLDLLMLLLILPLVPPSAGAPGVLAFQWQAPADHEGALGVRMTFDFGETNQCVFKSQVSGHRRDVPVLSWEEEGESFGAFYSVHTAQAHVQTPAASVDTRSLTGPGGAWSLTTTRTGTFQGQLPYTLVVVNGAAWSSERIGHHPALLVHVTCTGPFLVGEFQKGQEAFGFTSDSMSGGSGASVNQMIGRVTLVENDRASGVFEQSQVTMRLRTASSPGIAEGALRLDAPSGPHEWSLAQPQRVRYEDGPGTYGITLDYRAAGLYDSLTGILYGLSPVDSLDA